MFIAVIFNTPFFSPLVQEIGIELTILRITWRYSAFL